MPKNQTQHSIREALNYSIVETFKCCQHFWGDNPSLTAIQQNGLDHGLVKHSTDMGIGPFTA